MKSVARILSFIFLGFGILLWNGLPAYADAGHGSHDGVQEMGSRNSAARDLDESHSLMENVMRDCGQMSRDLQGMFDLYDQAKGKEMPASLKEHQEKMKLLLHRLQTHMEEEGRMLEELKAEGLGHEGHHR